MSHISEYQKEKVLTVQEGLELIKNNNRPSYIWNVVENSLGQRFEMGGRNHGGYVEVKTYMPYYDKEENIGTHQNGFANHQYSIEFYDDVQMAKVDYPTQFVNGITKWKTLESFIKELDTRDWIKNSITIRKESRSVIEYYNVIDNI